MKKTISAIKNKKTDMLSIDFTIDIIRNDIEKCKIDKKKIEILQNYEDKIDTTLTKFENSITEIMQSSYNIDYDFQLKEYKKKKKTLKGYELKLLEFEKPVPSIEVCRADNIFLKIVNYIYKSTKSRRTEKDKENYILLDEYINKIKRNYSKIKKIDNYSLDINVLVLRYLERNILQIPFINKEYFNYYIRGNIKNLNIFKDKFLKPKIKQLKKIKKYIKDRLNNIKLQNIKSNVVPENTIICDMNKNNLLYLLYQLFEVQKIFAASGNKYQFIIKNFVYTNKNGKYESLPDDNEYVSKLYSDSGKENTNFKLDKRLEKMFELSK